MARGRVVTVPDEYADLVLVPAMLHIDPMAFMNYPPALKAKIRHLMLHYVAAGGIANGGG